MNQILGVTISIKLNVILMRGGGANHGCCFRRKKIGE